LIEAKIPSFKILANLIHSVLFISFGGVGGDGYGGGSDLVSEAEVFVQFGVLIGYLVYPDGYT
jgi:hypothetical protein